MKVLHVTPAYYPATQWGGPITSVYALNNAIAGQGSVELTVVAGDAAGPRLDQRVRRDETYSYCLRFVRRMAGASICPELLWLLPNMIRKADVVHLTATYSFPTIPTLLACRILGKPVVWSPRGAIQDAYEWSGTPNRRLKRLWEVICNQLLNIGRSITHTTSERERVATQLRIPRARAVVIPNGVDVPQLASSRVWRPNGELRIMFIGRMSPKKGVENAIDAIALLDADNVSLNIYGGGDAQYVVSLERRIAERGLGQRVRMRGHVDGENKRTAFFEADVCIVPSFTENFCMVVAEALAHGVPVIASTGTPWKEVADRGCGVWVPNDARSLAGALRGMGSSDLERMGAIGRHWMLQDYSWSSVAARMLAVYRELANDNVN